MEEHPILRQLPSVDRVVTALLARGRSSTLPRTLLTEVARQVLDEHRQAIRLGTRVDADPERILEAVEARAERLARPSLCRVLNATGVLLHTNLGRAPLAPEAQEAVLQASGACALELELDTGRRGSRQDHVTGLLRRLVGAEAALVVNNNAAAVMLTLAALAAGREVVIARSEQVEIGGSFRMPDVMRAAGVALVEVGTTNRVRIADYESATTSRTALFLKVHRSNFRIIGFVSDVAPRELVGLGRRLCIPVVYDLGSGALVDLRSRGLPYEPTLPEAVADGFDLVLASGDKLLGGPQAGLIVGRAELVERLRTHPLYRVVRPDKLALAALEATLRLYLDPEVAWRRVPILRMLATTPDELRARAERLAAALRARGIGAEVVKTEAEAGGGSLPGTMLPSFGVRLCHPRRSAERLMEHLRAAEPPILARIQEDAVLLDLRSLLPEEDALLEASLVAALQGMGD
jgi:L-seryl-tRNA(Ser) seleniumtransferase